MHDEQSNAVNLDQVAAAMAAASPDADGPGQRVIAQTYRLLARGEPVSPTEIAEAADVPVEETDEVLRACHAFRDEQGRVTRFWGLSLDRLKPTHQIEANGTRVYGWCAWDTLFITEFLGTDTLVESTDPLTGEPIRLEVTPQGVKEVQPDGVVVSFLLPDGPFGPDVVRGFCHSLLFFASEDTGRKWMADHPGAFLLSVDDAFELGRITNRLRWPEAVGDGDRIP